MVSLWVVSKNIHKRHFHIFQGVLWIDDKAIEGSVDCINKCKEAGKKVYFVTNNSTKTQEQLLKKSQDMGFEMVIDEIISTSRETAIYLKRREFTKKAYVVGSQGITKELDAAGIEHNEIGPDMLTGTMREMLDEFHPDPEVGVVIVGFDEHLSFPKMMKAASYLNNPECLFLATNTDERFPMTVHVVPGTGSIVKAIETAAERKPIVIGKPSSNICETLIKEKLIDPKRTLMIGDRCNTDILLGANCGFQTLLVGTGIHSMDDVKEWMRNGDDEQQKLIPDVFLPKLGDLLQFL